MGAALFSALKGLKVLLVERTEYVGGTTAVSAGTTWVPNSQHSNIDDSIEKAAGFLDNTVGNFSAAEMRQAFLLNGPKAVAALEAKTDVHFRLYAMHPDYLQEAEGATVRGRALEPMPFDGRELGEAFDLLRPPIPEFTVLNGMMVDRNDINHLLNMTKKFASFRHAAKILGRYAKDRLSYKRGTRLVMGNALTGRLLLSAVRAGVQIVTNTEVIGFRQDPSNRVTGVDLTSGAVSRAVEARKGVVLASGGFNRHPQLRQAMLPEPFTPYSPAAPGHTGAAHDVAFKIGAVYGAEANDNAFWAPCSIRERPDGSQAVFPHFVLDRGKPGTVSVNSAGRRFINESRSYHEFARAMFETNKTVPSIPTFLICDAVAIKKYGLGMVRPGGAKLDPYLADGYLTEGRTLNELAGKLGIDAANLAATVADMNEYARTGVDTEFGRGTTPYHRVNGDPNNKPNPNLGPIGTAPFYAVKLYPGDIGAARGFATDTNARVLDRNGSVIPGLYACGNDMQSIMGGVYPAPGITIGPGLAFAFIAAADLAGRVA